MTTTESKWGFILVRGVLFWGYPTGLFAESIDLFQPEVHLPRFASAAEVAIFLAIWTTAGIVFGGWLWRENKEQTDQQP